MTVLNEKTWDSSAILPMQLEEAKSSSSQRYCTELQPLLMLILASSPGFLKSILFGIGHGIPCLISQLMAHLWSFQRHSLLHLSHCWAAQMCQIKRTRDSRWRMLPFDPTMSLCVTSCIFATSSNLRSSCSSRAFRLSLKCRVNFRNSSVLIASTSTSTLYTIVSK